MRPDEIKTGQGGADDSSASRQAATRIVRGQIDNIYDHNVNSEQAQKIAQQQLEDINPYQRTHTINPLPQSEDWKKYHTAWQNYYQQYYEGYYTHHLQLAKQSLENQTIASPQQPQEEIVTPDEAIYDLRQRLLSKVQDSAIKVKKSRHFIPILSGLAVILIFLFLQFNRLIFANVMAYVSPGTIEMQNIVIDPNIDQTVSAEPRLVIPKINVDVPVLYDIGSDYDSQMSAMTKGLAHFAIPGARSHPGEVGNTVISGHSSNDLLDSGDYKFIFAQLDRLTEGDIIYANYNSVRYTYTVTKKEVVKPSEINKLVYETTKPVITLITCTPIGTSINRLLVTAEQVSPDPVKATSAPDSTTSSSNDSTIPGNSPTLLERIFGK